MDSLDDLAALHDEEESPYVRRKIAERYEQLFGVHHDCREEFRAALKRILNDGGGFVDDARDLIRRDYEKSTGGSRPC